MHKLTIVSYLRISNLAMYVPDCDEWFTSVTDVLCYPPPIYSQSLYISELIKNVSWSIKMPDIAKKELLSIVRVWHRDMVSIFKIR